MPNSKQDQAAGLNSIAEPRPVRVIAVSGGKGGVGKTNVSINLGLALRKAGRDVLLLDTDLGLANIDVLLGLQPEYSLAHVINGERTLEEVIVAGPDGLLIVPGASGISRMAGLQPAEHAGLIQAFSELQQPLDYLVVDTAAGIAENVISFTRAAQDVLVVVCDEPASITDAYALIKVLSREHGVTRFHVVANMVRDKDEGRELYRKLAAVSDRFLDVVLRYLGAVPYDDFMRKAIQQQSAVVDSFPGSRAAQAFRRLAETVEGWPTPQGPHGHIEFFIERMIRFETGSTSAVQ